MGGLAPCGTQSAYRRHKKRGEEACDECLAANNAAVKAYQARKRDEAAARLSVAPTVVSLPTVESDSCDDVLADLKENLAIVKAAMGEAAPREVAQLSKRRQELVAAIAKESGKNEGGGLLDELRARREARIAGSQA